jgi:hypothetical protein
LLLTRSLFLEVAGGGITESGGGRSLSYNLIQFPYCTDEKSKGHHIDNYRQS